MSPLAALLLVLALAPLAQLLLAKRRGGTGRGRYRAILLASWLRFGLTSAVLLGLLGRWDAFFHLPPEFAAAARLLGADGFNAQARAYLVRAGAIGLALGVGGGVLVSAWRAWRGRPEGAMFGDASAVRPREAGELGWAALVALTAGISEEAYFRLLVPLLVALATGSAAAGFTLAALLFGAAHRYQGWRGVAATTLAGAALTIFYLATENLLATMAIHAGGDLGHLVIRPAVRGWVERRHRRSRQPGY